MGHKNKRKAARREVEATRREGKATMTTGPFPILPDADPADGTAPIVPVTFEMMEHAAHEVATKADSVAHEAPDGLSEKHDAMDRETPDPEPMTLVATPETEPAPSIDEVASTVHETASATPPAVEPPAPAAGSIASLGLLNAKVMEIAAANISAAGAFVSALLGATSAPEIAAINADHIQRRLDALTTQGRDVMLLAQKVAFDAMRLPDDGSRKP